MRILISSAIGLAVLASANVAEAACQQRDLAGRWALTGIGTTGTESFGVECNFAIDRRGGADGSCAVEILGFREELPILGGVVRVRPDCRVGDAGRLQLSQNGQVLNGIFFLPEGAVNLTGVKRPGGLGARSAAEASLSPEHSGCDLPLAQEESSSHATLLRSICQMMAP